MEVIDINATDGWCWLLVNAVFGTTRESLEWALLIITMILAFIQFVFGAFLTDLVRFHILLSMVTMIAK